jgi:hypothetical protein
MIEWFHEKLTELKMKWKEAISLNEMQFLNLNDNADEADRDSKLVHQEQKPEAPLL